MEHVRNRPKKVVTCQSSDVNITVCRAMSDEGLQLTILPCLLVADIFATRCYRVASSGFKNWFW
jgi:hypothetical protein